jgi:hypothetical protein
MMHGDFTKFPFSGLNHPEAASLTEAITADPVESGFAIITLKANDPASLAAPLREFARSLRAKGNGAGLIEVTAYRQLRRDEMGGAVPFDQPICEALIRGAERREATRQVAATTSALVLANPRADWIMLVEYATHEDAVEAVRSWKSDDSDFARLVASTAQHSVGAFRNMKRYASVSRDPNVIQFFNLFPSPGKRDVLWPAWQEALPWFFEVGEIRSSFPLLALEPEQANLLVNHAHCDSMKHFLVGTLYDPTFPEVLAACYVKRGVTMPMPFFCKIVPV